MSLELTHSYYLTLARDLTDSGMVETARDIRELVRHIRDIEGKLARCEQTLDERDLELEDTQIKLYDALNKK